MKVIEFIPEPVAGMPRICRLKAEVASKPFSWFMGNQIMAVPEEVDAGPIDPMAIPKEIGENWDHYGENVGRSAAIPAFVDLESSAAANRNLRVYGTITMVETVEREHFQSAEKGLLGFVQFLLRTMYIDSTTSVKGDLLPAAKATLTEWDEEHMYAFTGALIRKKKDAVTVEDVAQVVQVLTGTVIKLDEKNFSLKEVVKLLPVDKAASMRPDEFVMAAFPTEFMEIGNLALLLSHVDGKYYISIPEKKWPKNWVVQGPEGVKWCFSCSNATTLTWGPEEGTLYERALSSKLKMFPNTGEDIPFQTPLENNIVLDSGAFDIAPGKIRVGVRFLAVNQDMRIYRSTVAPVDVPTLVMELRTGWGSSLKDDSKIEEVAREIEDLYRKTAPTITANMGDRHFMVHEGDLHALAATIGDLERVHEIEKASKTERVEHYLLPNKPQNVRGILVYMWIMKHLMADSLCYAKAENDDFAIDALTEHVLDTMLIQKKTKSVFLITCSYSGTLGAKALQTVAVTGQTLDDMDFGI